MDNQLIQDAMRRAVDAAARGRANPELFLSGRFTGTSKAGTVTAWVDALGRLEHLALAPGCVQEGDEEGVTTAILEAYSEARRAATEMTMGSLPGQTSAPAPESDDYSSQSPLQQEPL